MDTETKRQRTRRRPCAREGCALAKESWFTREEWNALTFPAHGGTQAGEEGLA